MHRHLQFELFRPGPELVKSFYAEQPIALRVKGSFHDMAGLMADMAHFPHLVTLGNLNLVPGQDGLLTLEATARTYRHLEAAELAQQQNKAVARKVTQ
jgi:type IV pilus assembly protein PilO